MSCTCRHNVMCTRLGESWRSLACRDGELSGVNCGEARAFIGLLVRVGVGVETQTTALTIDQTSGNHVVDGTKTWPNHSYGCDRLKRSWAL
jgi:hypothetical protein